ncbi:MAG: hypothetical protein RLZZ393_179 [Pseudomonadota bacterium]|jgi:hypothetical protein
MNLHKIAGLLAIIVAVIGGFATIPYAALALLVLGLVAGFGVSAEHHVRVMVSGVALSVSAAHVLDAVPGIGPQLSAIVGGLAAFTGAATVMIVGRNMVQRFKP